MAETASHGSVFPVALAPPEPEPLRPGLKDGPVQAAQQLPGPQQILGLQDRRQDGEICLRAARDKVNVRLRTAKSFSDEAGGFESKRVHYVSGLLLQVGSRQCLQNSWVRTFRVIVREKIFVRHRF